MISTMKLAASAALLTASLSLGGCTMDDGYGYGGVEVGYGAPYYGYGYAPYGWYDGYYYPGSGYWLYDRGGSRYRWSDRQRRYWEQRREHTRDWRGPSTQPWQPGVRDDDRRRDWSGNRPDRSGERSWRSARDRGTPDTARPQRPSREPATTPRPANPRGGWSTRDRSQD